MKERKWTCGVLVSAAVFITIAVFLTGSAAAATEPKSVAEKLLDILRANKQITEQQYNELLKEARSEKEQAKAEREAARTDREAARAEREAAKAEKEAKAEKPARPEDFRAFWRNGLRFETKDKDFKVHIGGRVQTDFAAMTGNDSLNKGLASSLASATSASNAANSVDAHGAEFRRARIQIDGTMFEDFDFMTEIDFAGGNVTFQDVYLDAKGIPYLGRVRVGRHKEPFSLEELTSDNWTTFMERSLADCFTPARNLGVSISNSELDGRLTWALGGYEQTASSGTVSGLTISHYTDANLTARVTGLPWYEDGGKKLLHLGFGYSHKFRDPGDASDTTQVRFSSRPEDHLYPVATVDTGKMRTDNVDLFNPEIAMVFGPLSIQAEYMQALVDRPEAGKDADFHGWYAFVSYLLTGEHRPYIKSLGVFDRIVPKQNFSIKKGGLGAWEAAFRVSQIDLNDRSAGILGGKETDYTFGINWYPNTCVKLMFNYVHANIDDRENVTPAIHDGSADIFESRLQIAY